jgi:hypothetical protein
MPAPASRLVLRLVVILLALAGLGYLFLQTLDDARSEPFPVRGAELIGWTLAADTATQDASAPLVSLRPPRELPMRLFRQLFSRVMETMNTPAAPGVPLALVGEVGGRVPVDELIAMAREAGVEQGRVEPRCLAHRRIPEAGAPRQLYYLVVDVTGFVAFRRALAVRLHEVTDAPALFDPAGLEPVLMLAASHPEFARWLPVRDAESHCIAPAVVE